MKKLKLYTPSEIDRLVTKRDLTPHELGVGYLSVMIPFINGHAISGGPDSILNKLQLRLYREDNIFFETYNEYQLLGSYLYHTHHAMLTQYDIYCTGRNYAELMLRTATNVLEDKKTTYKKKTEEAEKIAQFSRIFPFSAKFLTAWNCFIDIVASVFHLMESDLTELRIQKISKSDLEAINRLAEIRPTPPEGANEHERHPFEKANMWIDLFRAEAVMPRQEQVKRFKEQYKKVVWNKNIDTQQNCYRFDESFLWISYYDDEEWKQWQITKKR